MSGDLEHSFSRDRIRWGIIGCGDIVRKRVAAAIAANPRCILHGAYRRDQSRLREFGREFGVMRCYASWEELVADPQIDALYIATPVALHAEPTIAGLRHGKHVLVEKPMAMNVAECDRMLAAAREAQKTLGVAYYRRFYPNVRRIAHAIQTQELGTLLSISIQTGNGFPYRASDATAWRMNRSLAGGGALMDIGSHRLDLLAMLMGPPESIQAICANPDHPGSVETSAHLMMGYRGGVHASLQCYFGVQHVPDEIIVTGSLGRLVVEPLNEGTMQWQVGERAWSERLPVASNLHSPLIDDFVEALLAGRRPLVTGDDGRLVNSMIAQAYAAAGWGI